MQPERQPLVTIVTPVYNAGRHIERCIESALAQTYAHWQQVIVDDGSSDDTMDRAARFSDARIRYFRMPHRGLDALAESYNTALKASNGALVAVLEGDDFWPADKLARQVRSFDDPSVMLSWGGAVIVDEDDAVVHAVPRAGLAAPELPLPELFYRLARKNIMTPTVTVMARRSALDAVGGFLQKAGAPFVDLPTWLAIAARIPGKAVMLSGNLGYYRRHATQTSQQRDLQMRFAHHEIVNAILSELDAQTLQRLHWDARRQRATLASAQLQRAVGCLRARQPAQARQLFMSALRRTRAPREMLRASLGVLSTVVGYDLVAAAENARVRLGID